MTATTDHARRYRRFPSAGDTAIRSRGASGFAIATVTPNDDQPAVGVSLRKGALPGTGDHIRFDHVHDGPDGWMEHVNSSTRGRRVGFDTVRFWLPMERVL